MIITEFLLTRKDGIKLFKTYSDTKLMIKQEQTEILYDEAVDVENGGFTYSETDIPVPPEPEESESEAGNIESSETNENSEPA